MDASRGGVLLSVNLAAQTLPTPHDTGRTGIGKHPVSWPVAVSDPGPKRRGHPRPNGLAGDIVCTTEHHGGTDQAVYAYAREDLDWWERELGYELPDGQFGENLTTRGLDLTGTLVGERWRIGGTVVLQATSPRIPCATFAHRMGEPKWVKRFTVRGATGTYLRVVVPGEIRAGDRIEVIRRPRHTVTIGRVFRALTTQAELLPGLLDAGDDLPPEERAAVRRRTGLPRPRPRPGLQPPRALSAAPRHASLQLTRPGGSGSGGLPRAKPRPRQPGPRPPRQPVPSYRTGQPARSSSPRRPPPAQPPGTAGAPSSSSESPCQASLSQPARHQKCVNPA